MVEDPAQRPPLDSAPLHGRPPYLHYTFDSFCWSVYEKGHDTREYTSIEVLQKPRGKIH